MKLKIIAGGLICLAMISAANAATCPTITLTTSQGFEDLKFSAARLKDKDQPASVVVCQYDGKDDLGASSALRLGVPVQATGSNWKGDDCSAPDGDANKCSFK